MKGVENEIHMSDGAFPCEHILAVFLKPLYNRIDVGRDNRGAVAVGVFTIALGVHTDAGERVVRSEVLGILEIFDHEGCSFVVGNLGQHGPVGADQLEGDAVLRLVEIIVEMSFGIPHQVVDPGL